MPSLALHFLLFIIAGSFLVLLPMLIGRLVRPNIPTEEKLSVYECGEPAIGSSYVQFDLRFYVVALLFIIFDVEVAFFFPWAIVYGNTTQLADPRLSEAARTELSARLMNVPADSVTSDMMIAADQAARMSWMGLADIAVFFGVLLVGFAYVWKRGDLDWVRAMVAQAKEAAANRPRAGSLPISTSAPHPETQHVAG
jgi:NADH-quinone oxidoreductase subunit A